MALTTQEEADLRIILSVFRDSKSTINLDDANLSTLADAYIEVVQDGISKRVSIGSIIQLANNA